MGRVWDRTLMHLPFLFIEHGKRKKKKQLRIRGYEPIYDSKKPFDRYGRCLSATGTWHGHCKRGSA